MLPKSHTVFKKVKMSEKKCLEKNVLKKTTKCLEKKTKCLEKKTTKCLEKKSKCLEKPIYLQKKTLGKCLQKGQNVIKKMQKSQVISSQEKSYHHKKSHNVTKKSQHHKKSHNVSRKVMMSQETSQEKSYCQQNSGQKVTGKPKGSKKIQKVK